MRRRALLLTALVPALLAACSQGTTTATTSSSSAAPAAAAASGPKPAPFDKPGVKVALVRQSGAGDYFTQWGEGAKAQAAAAGIDLQVYDAQQDNAKQATDLETAIGSGVAGIIVDHGLPATVDPLIAKAVEKKIPVVVYDADVKTPGVVLTSQSDASMAQSVLGELVKDTGKGAPVGYVSATGFAPLDRRAAVWQKVVADNGLKQLFSTGKVTASTATDNVPLVDAALRQHPDVKAIFAPYDEIAKGVVAAVRNNGKQDSVKVYGIDISNADIELMTQPGSPWVATAATDPAAVGAGVVRTLALTLAGQLKGTSVQFPAVPITQQFLRDQKITNMNQLRTAEPKLDLREVSTAPWLPAVTR